jgi:hypothetical protein
MKSRRRVNSTVIPLLLKSMGRLKVKFPDGTVIMQEPTGEDPTIYYLPAGAWLRALGIEVLPLYEEHNSTAVTIRIFEDHLARIESLDDSELKVIVGRLADALSRHYSRWENLTAEWPGCFLVRLGETALTKPFVDSGWHLQSVERPASFFWQR